MGTPGDRQESRVVLEAERDVVAGAQTGGSEHPGETVRLGVEFGVGDGLARGAHDDRGVIAARGCRTGGDVRSWEHGGRM